MTDVVSSYRVRSPETWAQARDAYLAGEAAESVCDRFGLGLSALRRRARLEGWRRSDQPDPEPADAQPADPLAAMVDLPLAELGGLKVDLADTIELTLQRLSLAVLRGRSAEAVRYGRLLQTLQAMTRTAAARGADPESERREVHELHELHPKNSGPPPHETAPSRAERRRRLRERQRRSSA